MQLVPELDQMDLAEGARRHAGVQELQLIEHALHGALGPRQRTGLARPVIDNFVERQVGMRTFGVATACPASRAMRSWLSSASVVNMA